MKEPMKIFLCHSSKDKNSFVRPLVDRLRSDAGISVWIDEDKILIGDDLDDKIFNEGIQGASAFVIVLSKNSIESTWVQRELQFAISNRLGSGCRFIPIVIDSCEIPDFLSKKAMVKINNLDSYNEDFDKIVMSIYGKTPVESLGIPPKYTEFTSHADGLTALDTGVLHKTFDLARERQQRWVDIKPMLVWANEQEIPEREFLDSLYLLKEEYYLELTLVTGDMPVAMICLTDFGMNKCFELFMDSYSDDRVRVIAELVNATRGVTHSSLIAKNLCLDPLTVETVLFNLKNLGLISATNNSVDVLVTKISPKLRRSLEG